MITILCKCCLYLSIFILYTIKAHSVVIQNKQNLLLRHRLYLFSLDFSDIYFSFITIFYFILNFLFSQSILENTWLYSFCLPLQILLRIKRQNTRFCGNKQELKTSNTDICVKLYKLSYPW